MLPKELKPEQRIYEATENVRIAMIKKMKADKAFVLAEKRKNHARLVLQSAKQDLSTLEIDLKQPTYV